MDLQALYIFYVTAKFANITRASEELNCSQPNISMRLQQLETSLNAILFNRHSKGVSLTNKGSILYKYANQIFALVGNAENEITGNDDTTLNIGTSEPVMGKRWMRILSDFHSAYPQVEVIVNYYPVDKIPSMLVSQTLELGFMDKPPIHEDLEIVHSFSEPLVIVGSHDSAYPTFDQMSSSLLFLTPDSNMHVSKLLEKFSRKNIKELSTLSCVISCVSAGMGYGFLPATVVHIYEKSGHMKAYNIPDESFAIDIWLVRHRNAKKTYLSDKFIELSKNFPATLSEA